MIQIINESVQRFYKDIEKHRLFLFGAGKRMTHICEAYGIKDKIEVIIDNDSKLVGNFLYYEDTRFPIRDINYLINEVKQNGIQQIILLITSVYYSMSIIEQLDAIPALNYLKCYVGILLDDYYEKEDFSFSIGENKIPKKIHYCWFGNETIPQYLQKYIDTWKEKCPDYEIIRWNETNYDITKNQYMKEAYECKKWGFVPDYARLDIVYEEGGIYLDTDVEVLTSLNPLLKDEVFCGFNEYGVIALGLGFGAVPHNDFIKELRDEYDDKSFYYADMSMNLTTCNWYQQPVFKKHGFILNNSFQKREGIVVYPPEVLAPTGISGIADNFTEKTISIHHTEFSWGTEQQKKGYEHVRYELKNRLNSKIISKNI